jgi:hypothetical protein
VLAQTHFVHPACGLLCIALATENPSPSGKSEKGFLSVVLGFVFNFAFYSNCQEVFYG